MSDKKIDSQEQDVNKLKGLSEVLTQYNLTAVEILDGQKKYRVEKGPENNLNFVADEKVLSQPDNEHVDVINSPMVGVFHDSRNENENALIKIGQHFNQGDVLCVIEAMKTFAEVRADSSGVIKEICKKNGDLIEFGQALFKYEKQ